MHWQSCYRMAVVTAFLLAWAVEVGLSGAAAWNPGGGLWPISSARSGNLWADLGQDMVEWASAPAPGEDNLVQVTAGARRYLILAQAYRE